ncbi:MAG: ATP-binding protein [Lachnospiraceae bacterium]|nr:ATP-binding protein [Lachnospiraceae bacterium]
MVVLDVCLDNFYAFKNFHMKLTYPKRIVNSSIDGEYLEGRPNFRYKKVNIIMGTNASGKTTFGQTLMTIFNFIDKKNYELLTSAINDHSKKASFSIDMALNSDYLYRVQCFISPSEQGNYSESDIKLEVRKQKITQNDSYETCVKKLEESSYTPAENYSKELSKIDNLDWLFEFPKDTKRVLHLPKNDEKFRTILENILKALDPSITSVSILNEVKGAYVIRLKDRDVVLQDGEQFTTSVLSSGTKAGVEVARTISSLMQDHISFCYCDEKFPYIHSDIEKAVLSLMIGLLHTNSQLFFTTHNTDILDMNLPKHSFTFLRKDADNTDCPIESIEASSLLKRSTDSLKNAVENDLFSTAPAVDLIYAIAEL